MSAEQKPEDPTSSVQPSADQAPIDRAVLYQVLESRRQNYDTMMWQVPALGLTAQAFLLTIALSAGASRTARLISSSLALVIAIMSGQLMAKHRKNETVDSLALEELERTIGTRESLGWLPHAKPKDRVAAVRATGHDLPFPWLVRRSSYAIWLAGLLLFGVAALAILVLSVIQPSLLSSH